MIIGSEVCSDCIECIIGEYNLSCVRVKETIDGLVITSCEAKNYYLGDNITEDDYRQIANRRK